MTDTNKKLLGIGLSFFLMTRIETPSLNNCIAYMIGVIIAEIVLRYFVYENK